MRPAIEMEVVRCHHRAWCWFARHHYLSAEINKSAKCFLGLVDGAPAVFTAALPLVHPRLTKTWRLTRTVVLPDFQGVGMATAITTLVGAICTTMGLGLRATTSHPALIAAKTRSPDWELRSGRKLQRANRHQFGSSSKRIAQQTAAFKYVGGPLPAAAVAQGRLLWAARS